jgi:hypothetical protein
VHRLSAPGVGCESSRIGSSFFVPDICLFPYFPNVLPCPSTDFLGGILRPGHSNARSSALISRKFLNVFPSRVPFLRVLAWGSSGAGDPQRTLPKKDARPAVDPAWHIGSTNQTYEDSYVVLRVEKGESRHPIFLTESTGSFFVTSVPREGPLAVVVLLMGMSCLWTLECVQLAFLWSAHAKEEFSALSAGKKRGAAS